MVWRESRSVRSALCDTHKIRAEDLCDLCRSVRQDGIMTSPAGWYADPSNPSQQRYWDGLQWGAVVAYAAPADTFGFSESFRRAFKKYTTFQGRATLREFWWFVLAYVLVFGALYAAAFIALLSGGTTTTYDSLGDPVATPNTSGPGAVIALVLFVAALLFALATVLPYLSVTVRRLHDSGKSGWWYWISLVPFIGGIWLLILLASPGTVGPNLYGPPSVRTN